MMSDRASPRATRFTAFNLRTRDSYHYPNAQINSNSRAHSSNMGEEGEDVKPKLNIQVVHGGVRQCPHATVITRDRVN